MRATRFICALAVPLVTLATAGWAQRLVEEDLPEPDVWEEIIPEYVEAEKVFNSRNQADSRALFDAFLAKVEENSIVEDPPEEIHALVANTHFLRAQVDFNVGDTEGVEQSLNTLLANEPAFAWDRSLVSSKFAELFDAAKAVLVGSIQVAANPTDARISVGRWTADDTGLLQLPLGPHIVIVERPGYSTVEQEAEAVTDEVPILEVALERTAAVLTLFTSLEETEIYVNDVLQGTTAVPSGGAPSDAARMILDDLQVGSYELSARKEGYRDFRRKANIELLQDYYMSEPIELEPTAGTIVLRGLPAGVIVRANGELVAPSFDSGEPALILPPGEYQLALTHPDLGRFEADVDIEDQDRVELPIRLRPPLILLGVLGGDETSTERLRSLLGERLDGLDRWALIDRSEAGDAVLSAAGVETPQLRAFAQAGSRQAIPWAKIQEEADRRAKGALYVLAVLSDELLADRAHVFLFPQAPLPTQPDVVDIALSEGVSDPLAAMLDSSIISERPSMGATIVDSPVAQAPLVVQIVEGGPAQAAKLRVGDEILEIDGVALTSSQHLRQELQARVESHVRSGKTVPLRVLSASGEREVQLAYETTPVIVGPRESDLLYSAAAYELLRLSLDEESLVPPWVIRLNQAAVFLRGGDLQNTIRFLQSVDPPPSSPIGKGQIKYLQGLALAAAGGEYSSNADASFSEAAEVVNGRLYHADGPSISPRAKARMRVLN